VLEKLSEAAGFIIVLEAQPRGRVDIISSQPVSKDEAFSLLSTVLNKNGYAAIRNGRTLTIVNRDEAKTKDIPVNLGSDPNSIPRTDELVTQIIPIQFVEATQLLKDLQPLVSMQTTMTANESGNSIVITDTQANIRRVAEVIKAIDLGAEDVTEVRVFKLTYADPVEMSELLGQLFPDETRSNQPGQGGGGFRSFFRGFGGPGGGGGNSGGAGNNQRIKKRTRVITVPDQRTASIVVTAAKDLMGQIAAVVQELDTDPAKKQNVRVFPLQNADPEQALQVLQDIFQKSGSYNNRNNLNNSALRTRSNQQQQNTIGNTRSGNRSGGRTSSFGQ